MKRVSLLVDQFYKHGGIERLVSIKANYWATEFDYDVTVISTENKGLPLIYDLDEKVKFKDLEINYNRNKSYFSKANLWLSILNVLALQKYIIKNKPDVIIVASHIPMTYILPFLYRGRAKIFKEIHFTKYHRKDDTSFKFKIFNWIEGLYTNIIALSEEEKSFYKSNNVVAINNPIVISETIYGQDLRKKKNIAVTVARFAPVKRIELLIEVWCEYISRAKDWELHIYGPIDSDYARDIIKLVEEKRLSKFVKLKGSTDNVLEVLSKAKVVLMTSEQECFPMLILEAFSVGVPVISFDCPTGPRNIISDNVDGLLVENNNVDAFVQTLNEFCSDVELQGVLAKGAKDSSKRFLVGYIMNKWKECVLEQ